MSRILHDFNVNADPAKVYEVITTPAGLDEWWTSRASGKPVVGEEYQLWFGPEYDWRARVDEAVPASRFTLEMTAADNDWMGTRVGFTLEPAESGTTVRFSHTGWRAENEHFRISSYCWAMYLRIMRRFAEMGETVPYEDRLNV